MGTDEVRAVVLEDLGVLGQPPGPELQAVVDFTARLCGVSFAQVNVITASEQHSIAAHGMDTSVCRREDSMCAAVLHRPDTVVVPDARLDPVFATNPFVAGPLGRIRFYASHPLVTASGAVIGRLCVFDERPRELGGLAESPVASLGVVADRVVDILELALRTRQLASTLERMGALQAELQASNERLASFAGQVSHDLKTPLSGVSLSLGLVREGLSAARAGTDLDGLRWLTEKAIASSARMSTLVDDMLAYAMVGGGHEGEVDLATVLGEVIDDLGADVADDGLALRAPDVSIGELPVIRGDHTQLRALFQNLLSNAVKYRDPQRRPAIVVSAVRGADRWNLEVADNGRGIAEADLERVFDPLVRADRSVPGNGIGLATCRRVVEAHGGRIGLRRGSPHGVVAWFDLPV